MVAPRRCDAARLRLRAGWFRPGGLPSWLLLSAGGGILIAVIGRFWILGLLAVAALGLVAARSRTLAVGLQPLPQTDLLEARNRQLQSLLQATRAMSSVLELESVAEAVLDQVVAHTHFTRAALVMGPGDDGRYRLLHHLGLTPEQRVVLSQMLQGAENAVPALAYARSTLQPVVVEDVLRDFRVVPIKAHLASAGVRALMTAPMVVQGRFTGALMVYLDRPGRFDPADISLVTALAGQAALALENARLYTLTVQSRSRLDQALAFLESISSTLTRSQVGLSPLIKQVPQMAAGLFAPARVRLHLDGGRLHTDEPGAGSISPLVQEPTVVRAESGGEAEPPLGASAACTLPLVLNGESVGRFEIELLGDGRRLDHEERSILQALVHLTASALGNAALLQELRAAVANTEQAYMGTLEALLRALETRDHETEGHSRRVVQYTLALAQQMGVPEEQLVPIMRGALLHDIGKIGIPDQILRKPEPLTPEEWEVMKTHSQIGYEMLLPIDFLQNATPIVRHHHERYDGSGYPIGLIGEAIPIGARIFAVADAYDALTSDRPYRRGRSHEEAVAEIVRCSGSHFDPAVVEALLRLPEAELARIRAVRAAATW